MKPAVRLRRFLMPNLLSGVGRLLDQHVVLDLSAYFLLGTRPCLRRDGMLHRIVRRGTRASAIGFRLSRLNGKINRQIDTTPTVGF
jgi:hypothetical protein